MPESPDISPAEIDALLAQVIAGAVAPQTAVQLLIVKGQPPAAAEEIVWKAMRVRMPATDRGSQP